MSLHKTVHLMALLLLALPAQADWGRLFYTPEERAALDRGTTLGESAALTTHRFDGEVRRSNGRTLRWVDGQSGSVQPPRKVNPGESWEPSTGKVYPAGRKPKAE